MNLRDWLERAAERYGERAALRYKSNGVWRSRTYRELLDRSRAAAAALWRDGVRPGDRVALFRENAPDWPEAYFGIVGLGAIAVPLDPKLREQEISHVLRDAGVEVVLCGVRQCELLGEIEDAVPALRRALTLDGAPPALQRRVAYAPFAPPDPPDASAWRQATLEDRTPASLIYTSGTTGRAKGAILTHGNFTANAQSCIQAIQVRDDDRMLLALPLHHSFAFTANLLVPIGVGAEICLVESLKTVGENMREVSPSILLAVPLLLDKLYRRILAGLQEKAVARLLLALGILGPIRKAVRDKLGGRLRLLVSGGAPCDPELLRGLQRFGLTAVEGYGLTEAGPVVSLNPLDAPRPGTVGRPLPGVEVKLLDADETGVGELAVRGPNVMAGYYHNEEATRETLLEGGWLATGDLASVDADGYIAIRGRKKALIVNREGKNIYPEEVEQQIAQSPLVLEALVLGYREPGERVGERVGAIVVPNLAEIERQAGGRRPSDADIERLVHADIRRVLGGISEYKHPRHIVLRLEEFEKTSTAKIKRFLYNGFPPQRRMFDPTEETRAKNAKSLG